MGVQHLTLDGIDVTPGEIVAADGLLFEVPAHCSSAVLWRGKGIGDPFIPKEGGIPGPGYTRSWAAGSVGFLEYWEHTLPIKGRIHTFVQAHPVGGEVGRGWRWEW